MKKKKTPKKKSRKALLCGKQTLSALNTGVKKLEGARDAAALRVCKWLISSPETFVESAMTDGIYSFCARNATHGDTTIQLDLRISSEEIKPPKITGSYRHTSRNPGSQL